MSPSSRPEERLKAKGHFPAGSSLFKQTETELLPELHHVATSHCEGDKEKDSLTSLQSECSPRQPIFFTSDLRKYARVRLCCFNPFGDVTCYSSR